MTTVGRPTFEPARGGRGRGGEDLSAISKQYSSRDLPAHKKLKCRYYISFNDICLYLFKKNLYATFFIYPFAYNIVSGSYYVDWAKRRNHESCSCYVYSAKRENQLSGARYVEMA